MPEPVYDKKDQYDRIVENLLPEEQVLAVYDAIGTGTGFVGLTSLRVVFQDNAFLGKKAALTSVPYSRITSVSLVSDKSAFGKFNSSSTIAVSAGGKDFEVPFRGDEKAHHCHEIILSGMVGTLK